jgi:hypothetical protein
MIKRWSVEEILQQIGSMKYHVTDPYMDGFTTWPVKQDLYRIKWAVDAALEKCPEFAPEFEFLKEHEKQQMWDTLSEKTNR